MYVNKYKVHQRHKKHFTELLNIKLLSLHFTSSQTYTVAGLNDFMLHADTERETYHSTASFLSATVAEWLVKFFNLMAYLQRRDALKPSADKSCELQE